MRLVPVFFEVVTLLSSSTCVVAIGSNGTAASSVTMASVRVVRSVAFGLGETVVCMTTVLSSFVAQVPFSLSSQYAL